MIGTRASTGAGGPLVSGWEPGWTLISATVLLGIVAVVWWCVRKLLTRRPAIGAPRLSRDAVRAALLTLSRPDGAFRVRDGGSEGVDLVAESTSDGRLVRKTVRVLMVLDAEQRVVRSSRAIDIEGSGFDGTVYDPKTGWFPSLNERTGQCGDEPPMPERRHLRRGAAAAMKRELRDTVLRAGWTWRDVIYLRRRGIPVPWSSPDSPPTVLLGGAVLLLGLLTLTGGISETVSLVDLLASAKRTEARIVELTAPESPDSSMPGRRAWYATVEYTADGQRFTLRTSTGDDPPEGDTMPVRYDPADPSDAYLEADGPDIIAPLLFGIGGIVSTPFGAVLLAAGRRKARLHAWLRQEGQEVWAAARVGFDCSVTVDGRHPYVIHAEWRDERTGRTHTAKSGHLHDDPAPRLPGRTRVRVLYDPGNPDRNMVDLDALR